MCILLKLDYAKFRVSNLFSSKVIEEKSLWGRLDPFPPPPPPLVKKGLMITPLFIFNTCEPIRGQFNTTSFYQECLLIAENSDNPRESLLQLTWILGSSSSEYFDVEQITEKKSFIILKSGLLTFNSSTSAVLNQIILDFLLLDMLVTRTV